MKPVRLALGVVAALGMAGAFTPLAGGAQSDDLLIRVAAPVSEAKVDDQVVIEIVADNAENLASFQFDLKFNSDVLRVSANPENDQPLIQRGEFLGSTNREVACPEPESQRGVVRFVCVTSRLEPAGPDGSGTLATITFDAIGEGATELTLDRVLANHPDGEEIPLQAQGGTLTVTGGGGTNWLLWGGVGAAVLIVILGTGAFGATRIRGDGATAST